MLRKLSLIAAMTAALAFPGEALAWRGGGYHGGYHGYHGGGWRGGYRGGYGYRGYGYRGYGYRRGWGGYGGGCRVWTPLGWVWSC